MCGSRLQELGPRALVGSGNEVRLPQAAIITLSVSHSSAQGADGSDPFSDCSDLACTSNEVTICRMRKGNIYGCELRLLSASLASAQMKLMTFKSFH